MADWHEDGIIVAAGISKSGKSYGLTKTQWEAARQGRRVLRYDLNWEADEVPADLAREGKIIPARSVDEAARALNAAKDGAVAIVRSDEADTEADAEAMCQWATGGQKGRRSFPRAIVVPEAHWFWPNKGRLSPAALRLATAYRHPHHRALVLLDTQRLAELHKTWTEQASELRVHAIVGSRDLDVLSTIHRDLPEQAAEAAKRMAAGPWHDGVSDGAGWFVRLGLIRTGPFELERL